jgi:hypothetical protein
MRRFISSFLVIAFIALSARADDAAIKKAAKEKVEEMNNAIMKEDFGKVADLTHPRVVELMGGRDKMVSAMEAGTKEMKSQGYAFTSVKVDDPSDIVPAGPDLYVVVSFQMEMKAPGGRLKSKSFVIGVSSDAGKTWTFVNGDVDLKSVKQVLPDLPDKLKLPDKQKPVFEKD